MPDTTDLNENGVTDQSPSGPPQRSAQALVALRRIQRQTEISAKSLAHDVNLTPSQLIVLQMLQENGPMTTGDIARASLLSAATITNLVDKLEAREFVTRQRGEHDRRQVFLDLLPKGHETLSSAPDLLQQTFAKRYENLPDWQQAMILSALEHVATILDAERLDAAPVLDVGALDEEPS